MKRVTGLGGIFFKSKDVSAIKNWYRDHLGFQTTDWGATFVWGDSDSNNICRTEWSPFKDDSNYYAPSTLPYMINYRVHDLRALIDALRTEGVTIAGELQEFDYGKFAHIMDPEGRKIELWEPIDSGFGDPPPVWTEKVTGIGGVFFKSENPKAMKEWYKKHLGISEGFIWKDLTSDKEGRTGWGPMDANDKFFDKSNKPYQFNYRVRDLKTLLKELKDAGVPTSGDIIDDPYGKFAWIIDPEGTKVDLWQP